MVRYNRRRQPGAVEDQPQHSDRDRLDGVPVLILVVHRGALDHAARRTSTRAPPKDALTVKATGYQWYWGYSYPDNGGFEVISHMLPDAEAIKRGEPPQLGADNRMVVPVGEPIRLQTTGADVIHAFARAEPVVQARRGARPDQREGSCSSSSRAFTTASARNCAARATATCRSRSRPCRWTAVQRLRPLAGRHGEGRGSGQPPRPPRRSSPIRRRRRAAAPARLPAPERRAAAAGTPPRPPPERTRNTI